MHCWCADALAHSRLVSFSSTPLGLPFPMAASLTCELGGEAGSPAAVSASGGSSSGSTRLHRTHTA
jgi:hypothetical protein